MPSCRVRARRSRSPTPGCAIASAPRPPSTSTRPVGVPPGGDARSGACSPGRRHSSASPPTGIGAQKQFGLSGLEIAGRMFQVWDEFRRDGDRVRLLERIGLLKVELRALLTQAVSYTHLTLPTIYSV